MAIPRSSAGHQLAIVRRSIPAAHSPCVREKPPGATRVLERARQLLDHLRASTQHDPGEYPTDRRGCRLDRNRYRAATGDVGLVARDVALVLSGGALPRIVMPQRSPVRTDILTVPPDVRPVGADLSARDVALVPSMSVPVSAEFRRHAHGRADSPVTS